ncbi:hypothetical protein LOTGIDRAFT_164537 [Lottia gigantea]|uniref:Sulfotransferase domain-containing protein n=1 Tax=Lottia gigantea TaxID=225164 RepID=V4BLY8_LOTGI|nr:hypothetical protein LOTGIDRAFT_164537 [Lottia gigantea]ESO89849.1 hypothetical protein LOTGIDRAFT_164537 [Lottia gigantea]
MQQMEERQQTVYKSGTILKKIHYMGALAMCAALILYMMSNNFIHEYIKKTSGIKGFTETTEARIYIGKENTKRTTPSIKIIIHTYMRSGSSFTAELIAMHPNIFFVFEPFHCLDRIYKDGKVRIPYFPYLNRPARINPENISLVKYDIMNNYLLCEVFNIDLFTLQSPFLHLGNQRTGDYLQCLHESSNTKGVVSCLPIFQNACSRAKGILIKTIRSEMSFYRKMMEKHQSLKIIQLVRDPRATLFSMHKTGAINTDEWNNNLYNVAKIFCSRVLNDLEIARELEALHPERVKVVMYEDIAGDPIKKSFELHKFVGIELLEEEKMKIIKKTSTGEVSCKDNMCTSKANSTLAASAWRNRIPFISVQIIDQACGPLLYDIFGLNFIQSNQKLRSEHFSIRKPGGANFTKKHFIAENMRAKFKETRLI